MGLHQVKRALSFIGHVIQKYIIILPKIKVAEVSKKPINSVVTPEQRRTLVKPDWVKKEKFIGLGQTIVPRLENGDIVTERVVEDMETGKKQVVKTVVKSKDAKAQKTEGGHWALTEAKKNQALDGAPGYIIISDNFGKAVKLKVDNINVDAENVGVDSKKYNLQGELRITGRTPVK